MVKESTGTDVQAYTGTLCEVQNLILHVIFLSSGCSYSVLFGLLFYHIVYLLSFFQLFPFLNFPDQNLLLLFWCFYLSFSFLFLLSLIILLSLLYCLTCIFLCKKILPYNTQVIHFPKIKIFT